MPEAGHIGCITDYACPVIESSPNRVPALPGLLDRGLLTGQYETTTRLRPERAARPVVVTDMPAALAEIELACQIWGGGGQPLLPVVNGSPIPFYRRLLDVEQIDFVGGSQAIQVDLPRRVQAKPPWDHLSILMAAREPPDKWRTVQVVDLKADDPWHPIYRAVLGWWPERPAPSLIDFGGLREDLRFEEIVPVSRVAIEGSLSDLIARIQDGQHLSPRSMANVYLASGLRPDTSFLGDDGHHRLPNPNAVRRAAGPNLIVAMSPGSVEDLALLWNLRGAHGDNRVLPIGVPIDQLDRAALRELEKPGHAAMFGLGGGRCHLVSTSVSEDALRELASDVPSIAVVPYETVLTFGPAPGRARRQVLLWENGRTRLDPLSETDREVIFESAEALRAPALVLDLAVDDYPLPTDQTMRGVEWYPRFQAGAAQLQVSARELKTVQAYWPSSWTALAAVCQSRGVDVAPSEPGLAAATLVRAMGGVDAVRFLQHPPLIDLLYRLAERSGMTWWKKRWKQVHHELVAAGADTLALEKAATLLGRDDPAVAPQGEGRAVPFQEFVKVLGSDSAARRWVAWSERRHLLVRGADIRCPYCSAQSWLPLVALPPPVPCVGCGRQIEQPYDPRQLGFSYRLGEPLRRVLETDSLGHVLTLYWFSQLFGRRSGLVGGYPGASLDDPDDKARTLGEVDVLLMFANGDLVPIEVKRRLAGVDERALQAMDSVARVLDAPWDGLVVTEPARDVPGIVEAQRCLPERPRVVLTDDQLHTRHIFWSMGSDPFAYEPCSAEQDQERDLKFAEMLSSNDPDVPWDVVSETLLDRTLGAVPSRKEGGESAPT